MTVARRADGPLPGPGVRRRADTDPVAKAAERLSYSQPGVTQQLHALERHLELWLFRREHGGLSLSTDGSRVLPTGQCCW